MLLLLLLLLLLQLQTHLLLLKIVLSLSSLEGTIWAGKDKGNFSMLQWIRKGFYSQKFVSPTVQLIIENSKAAPSTKNMGRKR